MVAVEVIASELTAWVAAGSALFVAICCVIGAVIVTAKVKGAEASIELMSKANGELREINEDLRSANEDLRRQLAASDKQCAESIKFVQGQLDVLTGGLAERIVQAAMLASERIRLSDSTAHTPHLLPHPVDPKPTTD